MRAARVCAAGGRVADASMSRLLCVILAACTALVLVRADCPAPRSEKSITHDIFSPDTSHAPDLVRQTMREIPASGTQAASERRLPYAPPDDLDGEGLEAEYEFTSSFIDRTLKKDPRLQPDDVSWQN